MKRATIVMICVLLGCLLLAYPLISNYLADKNNSYAITEYADAVGQETASSLEKEWDKARAYNESLAGTDVEDPFIPGSGVVLPENYTNVLALSSCMAYVSIPKIGINLPVYHGTSEAVLVKGAGHLERSSLPIGGINTHAVIAAHTGLTAAHMFDDLTLLQKGDMFYIYVLDQTLAYQVDQILVVEPEDTNALQVVAGEDYVTLLTCTPYGINTQRLLVRGVRVPYEEPQEGKQIETVTGLSEAQRSVLIAADAAAIVMLSLILAALLLRRRWHMLADAGARDEQ